MWHYIYHIVLAWIIFLYIMYILSYLVILVMWFPQYTWFRIYSNIIFSTMYLWIFSLPFFIVYLITYLHIVFGGLVPGEQSQKKWLRAGCNHHVSSAAGCSWSNVSGLSYIFCSVHLFLLDISHSIGSSM